MARVGGSFHVMGLRSSEVSLWLSSLSLHVHMCVWLWLEGGIATQSVWTERNHAAATAATAGTVQLLLPSISPARCRLGRRDARKNPAPNHRGCIFLLPAVLLPRVVSWGTFASLSKVLRNDVLSAVPESEVVTGDIVYLRPGDRATNLCSPAQHAFAFVSVILKGFFFFVALQQVPADVRVIVCSSDARVDNSLLIVIILSLPLPLSFILLRLHML